MKRRWSGAGAVVLTIALCGAVALTNAQTPGGRAASGRGGRGGSGGRGASGGAARGRGQQFTGPSASVRTVPQSKARIQTEAILGWRVGVRADAFGPLTFSDAAAKADASGLAFIEGVSTQHVSAQIAKNLDDNLTASDVAAVKARLNELRLVMGAYDAGTIPSDAAAQRKLFTFAKDLGADLIVGSADAGSLSGLDQLATEMNMNVALVNKDPKSLIASLANLSERVGVKAEGTKAAALAELKDRVLALNLHDKSVSGDGAVLIELSKLEPPKVQADWPPMTDGGAKKSPTKPVFITVDPTGAADPAADVTKSVAALDAVIAPAAYYRISELSRLETITPYSRIPAEEVAKVDAAIPRKAMIKPKKARKLLVMDLCVNGGYYHSSIQLGNLSFNLMAKYTGAFTPIFDNNVENLKYPKIKEYDAVFLNNVEGSVFADPEVLNGLIRFVKEGGGVGALHAASWASTDQPEYGELLGSQTGAHKYNGEPGAIRIDDPDSPLTKQWGGKGFEITDEFYHYLPTGPYSRDNLHILLSIDPARRDLPANVYTTRPDNDYGMAWIRSYGKGRVFQDGMGHRPDFYENANMQQLLLGAVQFILGDLPADTTPSAKLGKK